MFTAKYSTTTPTGSLRKGNAVMNISQDNDGPTSTTGFYNGIEVPEGGYLVILTKSGSSPAYFPCVGDTQLINLVRNRFGNTNVTDVDNALLHLAGLTDVLTITSTPNEFITDSLVLNIDGRIPSSYPRIDRSVINLTGEDFTGRLENGMSFNPDINTFESDGIDDNINFTTGVLATDPTPEFTAEIVIKSNSPSISSDEDIWCQSLHSANQPFVFWYDAGNNKYAWLFTDTNNTYSGVTYSNTLCITERFTHLLVTFKAGETSKLYINGELDPAIMDVAPLINKREGDYNLMNDTIYDNPVNGNMQYARAYFKELTPTEIKQNYFGGKIVTDGLVFAVDASNLVSYENGSVYAYSLTGSNIGVLSNGTGYLQDNGGVWEFDGVDDQLIGTPTGVTWFTNTSFSVEAWIKPDIDPPLYQVYFDGVGPTGGTNKNLHLRVYDYGALRMGFFSDDLNSPSGIINFGEWNHVIMQYNFLTDTSEIYHNGVKVASGNQGPFDDTSATFHIGYWSSSSTQYFKGNIGCTRVYSKVLSADEIKQNFEAQKSKFGF